MILSMKKTYIFNIVLLLLISNLSAQSLCKEQLVNNNEVNGYSIGQSIFMSECSGFFSSIEFDRSDDGGELIAELKILNGQTFLGSPRYVQTVTIPEGSGPFTIDFVNGIGDLSFFEDSQYTFLLSNSTLELKASSDINSYSNGQMFLDVGFINNDDLWFKLKITSTLGIDNNELKKPSLFPNPVNSYFQMSGISSQESFTIYNSLGAKVKNGIIFKDEKVDIQNLPLGFYYLKLTDGKSFKFVRK